FWTTAKARTINGEAQIHAKVDGKKVIISEASIKRDLQFGDEEGVDCLPTAIIFKQISLMRAATTASSLEVEQDSGNINKTQSKATPNKSSSQRTDSGEEVFVQEDVADKEVTDKVQKVVEEEVKDINTAKLIVDVVHVNAAGEVNAASITTT
nr:hypothetical protein [Tanacetum cinerariifolium]